MFLVVQIKDLVRLAPHEFGRNNVEAIRKRLDIKLSNKVIPDLGLCILIRSIDKVGDCTVFPGDGGAHCDILASIVVFRPFEGEVLQGRVLQSNRKGIKVSIEFFNDIIIPPYLMKAGTEYDGTEWVWKYQDDDDEIVQEAVIREGDEIHFRVHTIKFTKTSRSGKVRLLVLILPHTSHVFALCILTHYFVTVFILDMMQLTTIVASRTYVVSIARICRRRTFVGIELNPNSVLLRRGP